jgi:hypothetical protein
MNLSVNDYNRLVDRLPFANLKHAGPLDQPGPAMYRLLDAILEEVMLTQLATADSVAGYEPRILPRQP